MKRRLFFLTIALLSMGFVSAQTFTLKSKDTGGQATNRMYYNSFGYSGENISPELSWENPPAGTKSFAITMYDKDAPTGSGFWHWVIFNIPADIHELKPDAGNLSKNLAPAGSIQSITDFGKYGYGGPAPNPGPAHQYLITVYALKDKLNLDKDTNPALVGFNIHSNILAEASIVVYADNHPVK